MRFSALHYWRGFGADFGIAPDSWWRCKERVMTLRRPSARAIGTRDGHGRMPGGVIDVDLSIGHRENVIGPG